MFGATLVGLILVIVGIIVLLANLNVFLVVQVQHYRPADIDRPGSAAFPRKREGPGVTEPNRHTVASSADCRSLLYIKDPVWVPAGERADGNQTAQRAIRSHLPANGLAVLHQNGVILVEQAGP